MDFYVLNVLMEHKILKNRSATTSDKSRAGDLPIPVHNRSFLILICFKRYMYVFSAVVSFFSLAISVRIHLFKTYVNHIKAVGYICVR